MNKGNETRPEVEEMTAGERLEILLGEIRLTQTALGERCGKNLQYVNNIIRRGQRLTQEFAAAVHRETGVNLNWLYTGKGSMLRENMNRTPQGQEIPEDFDTRHMESRIRHAADDLVEAAEHLGKVRKARTDA